MDPCYLIVTVLFLCSLLNAEASNEVRETCSSEYTKYTKDHTMCLTDNPNAKALAITDAAKTSVVDLHNSYRSSVAEPAANMQKMYYNEDLAKLAEKWAMQCISDHDSFAARKLPKYPGSVGQNFWGSGGKVDADAFPRATKSWYSEIKDFVWGTWTLGTGHYIQEVQAESSQIGCGGAHCYNADGSFIKTVVFCNYYKAAGGTLYKKGESCGDCPNHCSGGKLCDCQGKVCQNGGKLNLGTCSCDCPAGFAGNTCSEVLCPGIKCKSEGTLNYNDCSCTCLKGYSGTRCENCAAPTSWINFCKKPGQCDKNWSKTWLYEICPNCSPDCQGAAAACGGKECKNLGTLDTTSCTCSCLEGYSGDTCETCPGPTSWKDFCNKPGQCSKNWRKSWLYKNCPNCAPACN